MQLNSIVQFKYISKLTVISLCWIDREFSELRSTNVICHFKTVVNYSQLWFDTFRHIKYENLTFDIKCCKLTYSWKSFMCKKYFHIFTNQACTRRLCILIRTFMSIDVNDSNNDIKITIIIYNSIVNGVAYGAETWQLSFWKSGFGNYLLSSEFLNMYTVRGTRSNIRNHEKQMESNHLLISAT